MNDGRHDRLSDDLEPVAEWIRSEQPEVNGLDLDRIKRRAMAQAAQGRTETTRRPALAGLLFLWKGAYMGLQPRPWMTLLLLIGLLGVLPITALAATGNIPDEVPVLGDIGGGDSDSDESGDEQEQEAGLDAQGEQGAREVQEEQGDQDAAERQYGGNGNGNGKNKDDDDDDDDDDGNGNNNDDDDDDGGGQPASFPGQGNGPPARNDCPLFRRNFTTPASQGQCATATQLALSGQVVPAQACAQFSDTLRRVRRSNGRGFVRIRSDRAACLRAIQLSQAALLKLP